MSSSTITAIHLERVMTFIEKLKKRWSESQSLLCVGLDPDFNRFPAVLKEKKTLITNFVLLLLMQQLSMPAPSNLKSPILLPAQQKLS